MQAGEPLVWSLRRDRALLTGETGELKEAIRYAPIPGGAAIYQRKEE